MDRLLARVTQAMDGASTLEELARPLLDLLQAVTGLESTYLTAVDLTGARQSILYARNSGALHIPEGMSLPWDDTPCRRALQEGRMQVDDVPARWANSEPARALGLQTHVCVPVRASHGELLGTLCAASGGRHVINAEAENVARLLAHLIGQHIERERLVGQLGRAREQLAHAALSDALTGLPNRRSLLPELGRMLARVQRDDRALVVAFVDLAAFKPINDDRDHDIGDRLVIAVARALEGALRGGDLVARVGDGEFVVAGSVPRESAEAAAEVLRERLEAASRGRFDIGDGHVLDYDGASVGVALARTGEVDADAVLARADRAMHEARQVRRPRGG